MLILYLKLTGLSKMGHNWPPFSDEKISVSDRKRTSSRDGPASTSPPIVLQKSKVAAVQIFGENLKCKVVDDLHSLSRATEVVHEFGARR